jgi:ribose/xylose/arabinose/galactoside ABC-type transport system permease subunit
VTTTLSTPPASAPEPAPLAASSGAQSPRGDIRKRDRNWIVALVVLLAAEIVYFSFSVSGFFGGGSGLLALTEQFVDIGTIALGLSVVVLAGEIDLSVGTMSSFSGIFMAVLWQSDHLEIWIAVVVALVASTLIGLANGLIITLFKVDSLLVTLAMQFILGSVATALSGASPPYGFPTSFVRIAGTGTIGPIPYQLIVFAVFAVGIGLFVSRSRMGRSVTLIGYNRPAARWSGIRVDRTIVGAFMVSAFMAAVSGILVSGYYNAARDDLGDSLLLPAVTIVVLGGVDIFGGRGRIGGVIVATFVLGYLTEGLLLRGDSSLTATMVTGILLILCLIVKFQIDQRNGGEPWARLRARFGRVGQMRGGADR